MRLLLCLSILNFLVGCSGSEDETTLMDHDLIERGFYHWKQTLDISDDQEAFLEDIHTDVLYIKHFDLVWQDAKVVPVSVLDSKVDTIDYPVVPTIYITTEVFQNIDSAEIESLAKRTMEFLPASEYVSSGFSREIQFDCDWTPSIKDKYFYFLETIKKYNPQSIISATIRLYQYKYPDLAGVPPVDKGLLMYYNMGDLTEYEEENSILNNETGKQYLGFNEYPLPLDIALPNFEWCLLFRQGQFEQICPNFTENQLKNNDLFLQKSYNRYIFKTDTVMYETYFRFGDELRHEKCTKDELLAAVELLKKEMNQDVTRILIYDLQAETPEDYEKIDAVFSAFE